ncbi:MAG TPA: hypothetical protein VGK73_00045 [Polyangiaceae bacterium]
MRRTGSGRPWLWAIALLGALALASRATGAFHDAARSGGDTKLDEAECARCHAEIARE